MAKQFQSMPRQPKIMEQNYYQKIEFVPVLEQGMVKNDHVRVSLVTGGGRGIGKEIARKFSKEGWSVVICSRTRDELQKTLDEITNSDSPDRIQEIDDKSLIKGKNTAIVADVSKEDDVSRLVDDTIRRYERIDVLVNNAGIVYPVGRTHKVDSTQWVNNIQVNLVGAFYCIKHVLPHMISQNYGKIINITSSGAFRFFENQTAYCSSKAAMIALTQCLCKELQDYKIDVNALAPSAIKTRLVYDILEKGDLPSHVYERAKTVLEKGGYSMDDVTKFAIFLASSESDGLCGKTLAPRWDDLDFIKENMSSIKANDEYMLVRKSRNTV